MSGNSTYFTKSLAGRITKTGANDGGEVLTEGKRGANNETELSLAWQAPA